MRIKGAAVAQVGGGILPADDWVNANPRRPRPRKAVGMPPRTPRARPFPEIWTVCKNCNCARRGQVILLPTVCGQAPWPSLEHSELHRRRQICGNVPPPSLLGRSKQIGKRGFWVNCAFRCFTVKLRLSAGAALKSCPGARDHAGARLPWGGRALGRFLPSLQAGVPRRSQSDEGRTGCRSLPEVFVAESAPAEGMRITAPSGRICRSLRTLRLASKSSSARSLEPRNRSAKSSRESSLRIRYSRGGPAGPSASLAGCHGPCGLASGCFT